MYFLSIASFLSLSDHLTGFRDVYVSPVIHVPYKAIFGSLGKPLSLLTPLTCGLVLRLFLYYCSGNEVVCCQ